MIDNKKERGAALLTVLLIIILFTILGLSLSSFLLQGGKQRAFANDQIEGKLLADTGLSYLKAYMETNARAESGRPLADSAILSLLDRVATRNQPNTDETDLRYRVTNLPPADTDRSRGGFGIAYISSERDDVIEAVTDPSMPSQPYVRKLSLYIIGLPARASADNRTGQKRVLLKATAYINTIDAPFRFAVSTPGDLHLLGGSNIIGDMTAHNILASTQYQYSKGGVWQMPEGAEDNQPYVEGRIILNEGTDSSRGYLYKLDNLQVLPPDAEGKRDLLSADAKRENYQKKDLSRSGLESSGIFTPKELPDGEQQLEAKLNTPYIPGYDIPLFLRNSRLGANLTLFSSLTASNERIKAYIQDKEKVNGINTFGLANSNVDVISGPAGNSTDLRYKSRPLALEVPSEEEEADTFAQIDVEALTADHMLVIGSDYVDTEAVPLTVRLTGDQLYSPNEDDNVNRLFIGPTSDTGKLATVEMGRTGSFRSSGDKKDGTPFTFNGVIYIRGNLDIVGDVKINGAIYVDGNVVIREAGNIDLVSGQKNNLAIIAKNITLTDRYTDPADTGKWTYDSSEGKQSPVLSAFLYSEESLKIYSRDSFNWIVGGLASADYISLNTRRESADKERAARLVVQFNRGIFERPTPGLPAGISYSLDVYDIRYAPHPEEINIS